MKNNCVKFIVILIFILLACGCSKKRVIEPDVNQLREISDWITLEAEYHNVAKIEKEKGEGIFHIGEVDRKLWVEYVGVIKIGIEADKINMKVKDNKIRIEMPEPSVLFINYKDYNRDSYFTNKDSWFNKNEIDYKDINNAMKIADEEMLNEVNKNEELFTEAKNHLEVLMENYINRIGKLSDIDYEIEFVYIVNK